MKATKNKRFELLKSNSFLSAREFNKNPTPKKAPHAIKRETTDSNSPKYKPTPIGNRIRSPAI